MKPENRRAVNDAGDVLKFVSKLCKKIRISVVWQSYYDDKNPLASLVSDIATGVNFYLIDFEDDFEFESRLRKDPSFHKAIEQYDSIYNEIFKEGEIAVKKVRGEKKSWASIPNKYYDLVARRIEDKYTNERVFVVPERWMPGS